MRTNIVLDDQLVSEALRLSGKQSKKEVVNYALLKLVQSLKSNSLKQQVFFSTYIDQPIQQDSFNPMSRDDLHER